MDISVKTNQISKIESILITILPFASFFGAFIKISFIGLSNVYSLIISIFVFRRILKKKFSGNSVVMIYFLCLIIYSIASLIWSSNINDGVVILISMITGIITMAYIASFSEDEIVKFTNGIKWFVFTILILAFYEMYTGNYIFFNNEVFIHRVTDYGLRYPGVAFTNPNDLAQFLIFGSTLITMIFIYKRKIFKSIIVMLGTLLVMTNAGSRLAMISTAIILGVYLLSYVKVTKIRTLLISIFIILIVIIGIIQVVDINVFDLYSEFYRVDTSQMYYTAREEIYIELIKTGFDNFLFGAGLGTSYSVSYTTPHNMFLFIFADYGALWFLGFLLILAYSLYILFINRKKVIDKCNYNYMAFAILTSFPIYSLISSTNEQRKAVWIMLGFVFALVKLAKSKRRLEK